MQKVVGESLIDNKVVNNTKAQRKQLNSEAL